MAVAYQDSPRLPVPATRVLGLLLLLLVAASASYAVLQVRITHVLCSNVATQQITYACVHAGGSNGACCCQAGTPCERRCAWNPKRRCRKHAGLDQKQAWGGELEGCNLQHSLGVYGLRVQVCSKHIALDTCCLRPSLQLVDIAVRIHHTQQPHDQGLGT